MRSVIFSVNNVQVLEHSYVTQEVLHIKYGCITLCKLFVCVGHSKAVCTVKNK